MRSFGAMAARALRDELRSTAGGRLDPRARRQAERLLRREPAYLSSAEKHALGTLVSQHEWLAHVQRMRVELSQLWEWKLAPPQELLAYLVDWCDRAERSGIQVLRNVARELHAYG